MSYLSSLPEKFRIYRGWKNSGKLGRYDFVSSITYVKYPPNSTFEGRKVCPGVQVVCDLSKPLPFADNSFDLIIANHVLEHVPGWWDCFKELARVVAPNGIIEVWVPAVASDGSFVYRDHINYMNIESFFGIKNMSRPGTNLDATQVLSHLPNKRSPRKRKSASRPGTNLDATQVLSHADSLQEVEMITSCRRPAMKWWIWFAPDWALTWMATYLRNVISEEGYFFKKTGK